MQINYTLERLNRKTLSITILQNGEVLVKSPLKTPMSQIEKFVQEKSDWIIQKSQTASLRYAMLPRLESGEKVQILGKEYVIILENCEKTVLQNQTLILPVNNKTLAFKQFCLSVFKPYIINKVQSASLQTGIKIKGIRTSVAKKRWGSCTAKNLINFNLSLCLLPENLIEYVIFHELCHVLQKNHGKQFYALLNCVMPNHKEMATQLKNYSAFCAFFSAKQ